MTAAGQDQLRKAKMGQLYAQFGTMLAETLIKTGAYCRVEPEFVLPNGTYVTCAGYTSGGDLHVYHVTNPASPGSADSRFPRQ